ncbi:MAG: SUMF1/EgtB/PvdO family nonheme iron enzyme [Thermoguttaceae bacterium]|nr:SUMF1/EgtB/PvdO family nonheme iron enzyme [Thermoguttaceae bacterium]
MANPQTLALRGGTITVSSSEGKRNILDDVTVSFHRGEFVGILGGSGSGKSTLIKSLAGINTLTRGEVLLNGAVISKERLAGDRRIAYLPQDVVIHEKLSCRRALEYIARLKNVGETADQRRRIIDVVLAETGMTDFQQTPICRLSGGQRKRAALAAELIGDPEILLFDEVTSGLDPATDEEMMRLFRRLADRGKTVICITHAPENLKFCHRVLYVMRGKVIFSGPLSECLRFFSARSIKEVYENQKRGTPEGWQARYRKYYGSPEPVQETGKAHPSFRRAGHWSQLTTLTQRYTRLQVTDPVSCFFLFLQTALIALLLCAFGSISPSESLGEQAGTIKGIVFAMLLSMLWCAGTSSVREIVKERSILGHEKRFGVRTGIWLISKLLFLFSVVVIQALSMLLIVRVGTRLPCAMMPGFFILVFTGFSGIAVGLLVSAFSKTSERAMVVLPIILIAQAIFAGVLFTLSGITEFAAKAAVPAYWSLQGLIGTFSQELREAGNAGDLILGYGIGAGFSSAELLLMTAVPLIATSWALCGGFRSGEERVLSAAHAAFLAAGIVLILLVGKAGGPEGADTAVEIDQIDFTYREVDITPLSESPRERVRRAVDSLAENYGAYKSGKGEALARAANLLENLKERDRETYDSESREFLRLRELVETARRNAYRNVDICPKTEKVRIRAQKDADALETLFNGFDEGRDPDGLTRAYNYLKNIELKDPAVYDYASPREMTLRNLREKIERARELLDERFDSVRDEISRYDRGGDDADTHLKGAREQLEGLTDRYSALKTDPTVEALGEQVRVRYRGMAEREVRQKIEEALDASRGNQFDDLEVPEKEEMPAEPAFNRIKTRGKTPEQIKEERDRIAANARREARETLLRQRGKVRDRLEEGFAEIDGKLAEIGEALDQFVREYPAQKGKELETNLRGEADFERARLKALLSVRVYEKTEFPEVLDETARFVQEMEKPEASPERRPLVDEAYNEINEAVHGAQESEIRRKERFRAKYEEIETQIDEEGKAPKSAFAEMRGMIRTDEELEDYFELQGRSLETKGIGALPEKGTEPGETITLSIRGVDFPFAWCPAGSFMMGSPEEEDDRQEGELLHRVTLSDGFWILRTEVTQEMYAAVTESNPPSWQSPTNQKYLKEFVYSLVKKGIPQDRAAEVAKRLKFEKFPVESIARTEAVQFCDRLNELFRVKKGGEKGFFALPTEAQWEYACRAGEDGPYSTERLEIANADERLTISGVKIRMIDYGAADVDHGSSAENAWHISDMHGNVSEWCRDIYAEYTADEAVDPLVKSGGDEYVVRGGSWNLKEGRCRSASRQHWPSGTRERQIGFRIVITRQ